MNAQQRAYKADALRRALAQLEILWPILFSDVYDICDQDRAPDEWHPTDHWFGIRRSLETRLAGIESAMLAEQQA
jgi:hypothetical protein